jgi:hypothetical protein
MISIGFGRQPAAAIVPVAPSSVPESDRASQDGNRALRTRLEQLNADIVKRGIQSFPQSKDKLLTGYAYGEFFDWDLYFENIYLSYYGVSKFNFTNMQMFLSRQLPDGFISRTLVKPRPTQMFKPFLAQLAVLGSEQTGSYEWLRAEDYAKLQKYIDRWFAYDGDRNGLPTWNSSDASGMDNQLSRSGYFDSYFDEGVDLACYLYRELESMGIISGKLGKTVEKTAYQRRAAELAKRINDVFWDERDGFYYDRNEKTGQRIPVKSVAGFFPLWAGIASQAQATRLVHEHLLNEKEFWTAYPVATYALTEQDFYEGSHNGECNWRGSTWIPANYMIFHGLMDYGFNKEAKELANRTFTLALYKNHATREYYESESGEGRGIDPFWGWSSLAYVMPLEAANKYDPTKLDVTIKPLLTEMLGVKFPAVMDDSPLAANPDLREGIHELDVAPVWSGSPVQFALLTHGDQQYVAYYAPDGTMTIAQRRLGERTWRYTALPTAVGWDSHNYIAMAFDSEGYLHVSGNMHAVPLIYFRSTRPGDASTLVRVASMTGKNENSVTYPLFSYSPEGDLLFEYRNGKSGAGDTYRNRYDVRTKTWTSLTDQPLFVGGSARNAYPINPVLGPDGWYHQVWDWRESPMAETNHDLSYARTKDFIHWETADGKPIKLPITIDTPGLTVDPVPVKGGLINGSQSVGFDTEGGLVIGYTKYDANGNTQLYFARWQEGQWKIQQASDWSYRWDFHGGGSIPMQVMIGGLKSLNGRLTISVRHVQYGAGLWEVDPISFKLIGKLIPAPVESKDVPPSSLPTADGMIPQVVRDMDEAEPGGVSYSLTWNALGPNRDQPRPEGPPAPSMLRLLVSQ